MTGPVTTEALVGELAKAIHLSLHPGGNFEMARDNQSPGWMAADALAEQIAADFIAPLLAAHQQVTAKRDEARSIIEGLASDLAKERIELARLRAEGEAKDRALLLLLPFVDYAAGEGLMFVETEDGEHPEMDAADIMAATAEALGLELGSDAYLALLPAGYDAIRAARAATAREGQADE